MQCRKAKLQIQKWQHYLKITEQAFNNCLNTIFLHMVIELKIERQNHKQIDPQTTITMKLQLIRDRVHMYLPPFQGHFRYTFHKVQVHPSTLKGVSSTEKQGYDMLVELTNNLLLSYQLAGAAYNNCKVQVFLNNDFGEFPSLFLIRQYHSNHT